MTGCVELPPSNADGTAPKSPRLRLYHFFVAFTVAAIYLSLCQFVLRVFGPQLHFPFLVAFPFVAAVGAVLGCMVYLDGSVSRRFNPAIDLGIQTIFWNPVSWLACMSLTIAVDPSSSQPVANAFAIGTVMTMVTVLTSVSASIYAEGTAWKVIYVVRSLQGTVCCFLPVIPALVFLVVLLAFCLLDSSKYRYGWPHRIALALVVIEQVAAIIWLTRLA